VPELCHDEIARSLARQPREQSEVVVPDVGLTFFEGGRWEDFVDFAIGLPAPRKKQGASEDLTT
jgi:hypothetical protein